LRTRAERRKNSWKKAKRQVEIERNAEGSLGQNHKPFLKSLHAYSKNKVPYSDPEKKTSYEWDINDQRKIDEMDSQLDEQENF